MNTILTKHFDPSEIGILLREIARHQGLAIDRSQIPSVGALVHHRPDQDSHILQIDHNRLNDGHYFYDGIAGTFQGAGRYHSGFLDCEMYCSLPPCLFSQWLLWFIGIRKVHVLDPTSWKPEVNLHERLGITIDIELMSNYRGANFEDFLEVPENQKVWEEYLGLNPPVPDSRGPVEFDDSIASRVCPRLLELAKQGLAFGEAPVSAVILDGDGEILAESRARIVDRLNPSLVPSLAAGRSIQRVNGHPISWADKTLVLSTGPNGIDTGLVTGFNFGQVVVMSDKVFKGTSGFLAAQLGHRFMQIDDERCDQLLSSWLSDSNVEGTYLPREYFGARQAPFYK